MSTQLLSKPKVITPKAQTNAYEGKPLIETIANGYFIIDHNWTVKYWNKAAEKLLRVSQIDIVGKNLWQQFAKLIPVEFYAVYNKAFIEDIPIHFLEYWGEMGAWFDVTTWYSENTLYVSFKSSSQPYLESDDSPQERLNTLTKLYRHVTEITNDCLWEWDLGANEILWIDGGHKRVFGYPIENTLVPVSFWKKCVHPDDRVRVLASLKKIINERDDYIWEEEYRFKKADGSYSYVCDRGHIVYDGNNNATRIIGATQDISKRVLMEKELASQKKEQQHEITNAVMTALETERTSIGMELHDNLGQMLAVSKMYMQMAQKTGENQEAHIENSISHIKEVIEEIRKISKILIIPPPHIISLSGNIKILINDVNAVHPIKIKFHETGLNQNEIPGALQINIFRIIQEQLNNILKHSDASGASITLNRHKTEMILVIADNGKGHDVLKEKKGVGIINIKSRVELWHGSLTINSKPGQGYELKAVFPFDKI